MAETSTPTNWAAQVARKEARPRILFSDRMVTFTTQGIQNSITPMFEQFDGVDSPAHPIYAVGPEDLKPENHEKLKAKLAEKVKEAKALPFSKNEQKDMQDLFFYNTSRIVLEEFTIPAIKYISKHNALINEEYNNIASFKNITAAKARDQYNPYTLFDKAYGGFGQDEQKMYLALKKMFRENNRIEDFALLERKAAEEVIRGKLRYVKLDPAEENRIVEASIRSRTDDQGKKHLFIDIKPLEQLRRQLIDSTYSDLETIINNARQHLADISTGMEIADPFSYTAAEQAKIDEIDAIAHADRKCKPVMLAGYCNPDLTIIVERGFLGRSMGISYGSHQLIQVEEKPKQTTFPLIVTEEILHQGMENIYHNESLPYRKEGDNRKALMERAFASDITDKNFLSFLGLTAMNNYNMESPKTLHQEVPVKILKYKDDKYWDTLKEVVERDPPYPTIEKLIDEVILKDAIAHNQNIALPDVADDLTRTPAHVKQALQNPRDDKERL